VVLPAAVGRQEHPAQGKGNHSLWSGPPLQAEWARAFELWLAGKAENTRRAYGRAWEDLLRFSEKQPWEMLAGDVRAWTDDLGRRALDATSFLGLERRGRRSQGDGDGPPVPMLRGRDGNCGREGLSASTIAQWLSAVSSFYRYVTTRYVVPSADGRERPLHDYNPTLTVARPDVSHYARAEFLDSEELARLLQAIPRKSAAGLRDYALILGYVLTGRRNSEWRTLRWGDLRGRGAQVYYTWRGKNTDQARNEVPPPLWEAVLAFLEAAGRLDGMRAEDYLFTPLSDRATRLPSVGREGWDANRPLTGGAVNRILKKHARRAGLDASKVHVHVLRHSAAMLEDELGSGLAEIVKFLGHADPKTTMRYLGHLRGRPDRTWERKCAVLGIGGEILRSAAANCAPLPFGSGRQIHAAQGTDAPLNDGQHD
jgi:integrase